MAIFGRAYPIHPFINRGLTSSAAAALQFSSVIMQRAVFAQRATLLRRFVTTPIISVPMPPITVTGGNWLIIARRRFRR